MTGSHQRILRMPFEISTSCCPMCQVAREELSLSKYEDTLTVSLDSLELGKHAEENRGERED